MTQRWTTLDAAQIEALSARNRASHVPLTDRPANEFDRARARYATLAASMQRQKAKRAAKVLPQVRR